MLVINLFIQFGYNDYYECWVKSPKPKENLKATNNHSRLQAFRIENKNNAHFQLLF